MLLEESLFVLKARHALRQKHGQVVFDSFLVSADTGGHLLPKHLDRVHLGVDFYLALVFPPLEVVMNELNGSIEN